MATKIVAFGGAGSGIFNGETSTDQFDTVVTSATFAKAGDFTGNGVGGSQADGSEIMYNICEHFHSGIQAWPGGAVNVTSAKSQTASSGTTFNRTYSFTFTLDMESAEETTDVAKEADD